MGSSIGPILQRGAIAGITGPGGADSARRFAELREALGTQQGGGVRIGQGDTAERHIIDVGVGDHGSFGDTLKRVLNQVSDSQDKAADAVQKFVRGEPIELHQVMAATEEAGIALEMLVELRGKLTDAYRAIANMQS